MIKNPLTAHMFLYPQFISGQQHAQQMHTPLCLNSDRSEFKYLQYKMKEKIRKEKHEKIERNEKL